MAAKIDRACLQVDPTRIVWASDYNKQAHGLALCPDARCRCVLEGVQASTRNINDTQVRVDAFFRLPKLAEAAGRGHTPSCRFNAERTVTQFVDRSRELRSFDPSTEPFLRGVVGGAELRLHILMELWYRPAAEAGPLPDDPGAGGKSTGRQYLRTNRVLKPYLRVAKGVVALMARIQERPELERLIRLKYGPHRLTWEEYFFDFRDYEILHDYLVELGQFHRRFGEGRPVAVVVEIKRERLGRQTQYGSWQVRCVPVPCADEDGDVFNVVPTLYTRDRSLAAKLVTERYVLVCAIPTITELKEPFREGSYPFVDLRMTIVDRSQVCRIVPTWSQ